MHHVLDHPVGSSIVQDNFIHHNPKLTGDGLLEQLIQDGALLLRIFRIVDDESSIITDISDVRFSDFIEFQCIGGTIHWKKFIKGYEFGFGCLFHTQENAIHRSMYTSFASFGCASPMQNSLIFTRNRYNSFLFKLVIFGDGVTLLVQGYEPWAIERYISQGLTDIIIDMEQIEYTGNDNRTHSYTVDFIVNIPSENDPLIKVPRLVEVKSVYRFQNDFFALQPKARQLLNEDFEILVFNDKAELVLSISKRDGNMDNFINAASWEEFTKQHPYKNIPSSSPYTAPITIFRKQIFNMIGSRIFIDVKTQSLSNEIESYDINISYIGSINNIPNLCTGTIDPNNVSTGSLGDKKRKRSSTTMLRSSKFRSSLDNLVVDQMNSNTSMNDSAKGISTTDTVSTAGKINSINFSLQSMINTKAHYKKDKLITMIYGNDSTVFPWKQFLWRFSIVIKMIISDNFQKETFLEKFINIGNILEKIYDPKSTIFIDNEINIPSTEEEEDDDETDDVIDFDKLDNNIDTTYSGEDDSFVVKKLFTSPTNSTSSKSNRASRGIIIPDIDNIMGNSNLLSAATPWTTATTSSTSTNLASLSDADTFINMSSLPSQYSTYNEWAIALNILSGTVTGRNSSHMYICPIPNCNNPYYGLNKNYLRSHIGSKHPDYKPRIDEIMDYLINEPLGTSTSSM